MDRERDWGRGSIGHIMTMHLYSKESSKVTTGN